jgi:NDP-sugar pyrophosphorylase family protein
MKPALVVLAAGMGSRYGGLKQLDHIGPSGEFIIDYSVYDAIRAGFGKVVFVIRKDIEKIFRTSVSKRYEKFIDVAYAFQEIDSIEKTYSIPQERSKPWGTGHALLVAEKVVNTPFAVINADDFYGKHGYKLLADFLHGEEKGSYAMVGFKLDKTLSDNGSVSRGICKVDNNSFLLEVNEMTKISRNENGQIKNISPDGIETSLTGKEIVSLNMWGFQTDFFEYLNNLFINYLDKEIQIPGSEFYLPAAVHLTIMNNSASVKVLKTEDNWFGVTYKKDKPTVMEKIKILSEQGIYPEKLFHD